MLRSSKTIDTNNNDFYNLLITNLVNYDMTIMR